MKERDLVLIWLLWRGVYYRVRDRLYRFIVGRFNDRLLYYAFARGCAEATSGPWEGDNPHEIDCLTAICRIDPTIKEAVQRQPTPAGKVWGHELN